MKTCCLTLLMLFGLVLTPLQADTSDSDLKIMEIPLSDDGYMVDQVQAEFIIDKLNKAEREGYDRVILMIDTYGGLVFSARDISEKLLRMSIPTTAYVKTKAISAGTFIAYACDEIIMEKLTTMGDAQMITMDPTSGDIKEAPEKMVTVFRSDWQKSCDAKGRSFALAQGYFDVEAEVLQITREDGSKTFMLRRDYEQKYPQDPPAIDSVISAKGKLLTLHSKKAQELGVAQEVDSYATYLESIGVSPSKVHIETMTTGQKMLRFLGSNSWIFVILVLLGLNGIYMELKAPGFGIPGLTALVCFTLIFGSRFLLGTATGVELALFGLGLILCLAEIFVLPGFGICGLSGIACMFLALILAALPDFGFEMFEYDLLANKFKSLSMQTLSGFVLALLVLILILPKFFRLPAVRAHMGDMTLSTQDGYIVDTTAGEDFTDMKATATSDLKPAGKITLRDGRTLDAISDEGYIDRGQEVYVSRVDGNHLHVRKL